MVRQLILVLSLTLFVGSSYAVISELARQGESAIQGLADIKLAPLRYLDAIVGTNPGGLGFYGGAGGAVSAAAALQAAHQLGLGSRLGLGPLITKVGQGDDLVTIIKNPGPFNPLVYPYPGYPYWPRPSGPGGPYGPGGSGGPGAPGGPGLLGRLLGVPGLIRGILGGPAGPGSPGGPGNPGGPGSPSILGSILDGLHLPHLPGINIPLPRITIGAGSPDPRPGPGMNPGAGGGLFNYGGLFGTGIFGTRGLFGSGFLPGWILDPLGIFTPIGNLFEGLGSMFGMTSNVQVERRGLLQRNVHGSLVTDLDLSIPTPIAILRQLLRPVLKVFG